MGLGCPDPRNYHVPELRYPGPPPLIDPLWWEFAKLDAYFKHKERQREAERAKKRQKKDDE